MKLPTLVAASLLVAPLLAFASGGDGGYDENIYAPQNHVPAPEIDGYAAGKLGVVSGAYFRIYRVLAWRALHGAVSTPGDVKGLELRGWSVGPNHDSGDTGVAAWLSARALVVVPGAANDSFEVETDSDDYASYLNCPFDGLQRAAQTARDRLQRYGAPAARTWLAGQDAVFANCAPTTVRQGGHLQRPAPTLPAPLPADAPDWLQADRAYQTAAALFYAGEYPEARQRFLAIAGDKRSPWQPLGAYLAARCLIRQATLLPGDKSDPASAVEPKRLLTQARRELLALAPSDPAAGRLVGWVDARLRPGERAAELAHALQTGTLDGPDRVAMLNDYLRLMDSIDGADALAESAEPMTSWIGLMQSATRLDATPAQRAAAQRIARRRWHDGGDAAWLMPVALQAGKLGDLTDQELKAMRAVPAASPAWQTLHWHLVRLELVSGQAAEADQAIDAVLAEATLAPSTRNRWLQLKLASAPTVEAMLAAAPRARAEPERGAGPIPDEGKPTAVMGLDDDFTRRLDRQLPLSRLAAVSERPDFPASLHTPNVEIAFTRALILEEWAVADRLANAFAEPRTTTQALYKRYLAAKTPRDKKLAAALILVNTPELNPSAIAAGGNTLYWGCRDNEGSGGPPDPLLDVPARFLSDGERASVQRENAVLGKLPVRTHWLADALLPWAATKPNDAEAPKALFLLVASTRMECASAQVKPGDRNQSHEAYDLLHKLWPRTEWAAKTKYWF